ncbi:MAG: polyketide synthase, partial [Dolichospermum sp.]
HILSPSQKGQYLALERAYGDSPLADYIECHATGTPLGDRTELNTLEKFFQAKQSVSQIGANKAHLGHLLTASGMVSLIKSIWAIKQGIIPPTIGIDQAITSENGVISSENIVQSPTPWKKNHQPKRIGINAFGFGGTNAH